MLRSIRRLAPILILALSLFFLSWRLFGAIQSNRAFVTLNHLPSLFTTEADAAILATVETQLVAALQQQPARASTRRMLALVQRAQGETEPTGITAGDLLWWGQQKHQAGELDEARYLYRWLTELEPDLGDAWYYSGRVYEADEAWEAALQAYERATAASTWQDVGRSDVYVALGDLYRTVWPGTQLSAAQTSYRHALIADHFSDVAYKAAAHYQLGELLLWNDDNPAAAIPHYQAVLAITPADHWARLRLGYALYWNTGDLGAAETEILRAIDQWPDEKYLKWPYFYLGEIYQDAGLAAAAIAAYERLLALDPTDERVRDRLTALRSR